MSRTPKKQEPTPSQPSQAAPQAIIAALVKQRNNLANEVALLEARLTEALAQLAAAQPDVPDRPEITD